MKDCHEICWDLKAIARSDRLSSSGADVIFKKV